MTEEARAVAEVAKTGGEIVKAAGGLGAYLAGVVGSIPHDVLGLLGGDWLKHKRIRNLGILEANTARCLNGLALERLTEPSPSLVIPLLQAAIDEDREELQTLWAAMLANAMVDKGKRVRRDFFEVLRSMEPSDAVVLSIIARCLPRSGIDFERNSAINHFIDAERLSHGLSRDDYEIALGSLEKLGCVSKAPGDPPALTAFGRSFLAACTPPQGPTDLSKPEG